MWGTEFSGPMAAVRGAFVEKAVVICNKEKSDVDALEVVESLYKAIGNANYLYECRSARSACAYVSHISHITSLPLPNTVLEKEKEDDAIFELASGGFEVL
jgi:prephenate dehydrogenase